MSKMRKSERAVTDPAAINAVLEAGEIMNVAYADGDEIYVVPVNYGYETVDGRTRLYYHGAGVGRKAELAAKGGRVGFDIVEHCEVVPADQPCNFTAMFRSIIGSGRVSSISDLKEKKAALNVLMKHLSGRGDYDFPEQALQATGVFCIEVEELSCKEHAAK
ncbi:MAG: pyridoxamine 5'-phosphate oxidase family protein [Anaerovoracaceae bacterium]|jgi:nitroimidazol reductase NimA-like FMN-containing flavoprotein (pyridoxamine 5'-phosphate oxidase superfamily)